LHDIAVAARILEAVKGRGPLRAVHVLVGRDSCLTAEHLTRSFDALKRRTEAENAELVVLRGPGSDITVISVEAAEGGHG
jgi:Zn finger protein HypA/HybF involved in hydrogenase expression